MDNLDTLSTCSGSSISSRMVQSNTSSLSSYQDEYLDLKRLIDPEQYSSANSHCSSMRLKCDASAVLYEERIQKLTIELVNAMEQVERYKIDMDTLRQRIEMAYHEKIQGLLRRNAQLEASLTTSNDRFQRLIDSCTTAGNNNSPEDGSLKRQIVGLEKANHDLTVQISLLNNELAHWKCEKDKADTETRECRIELSDLKNEFNVKMSSIKELKMKISDQHVTLQGLSQDNFHLQHSQNSLINELDYNKKNLTWYKDQLHLCQNQKQTLSEELSQIKQNFTIQTQTLQESSREINKWKCRYEKNEINYLKEKNTLLNDVKNLKNSQNTNCTQQMEICKQTEPLINYYEETIQDLTDEVVRIKKSIEEQQIAFSKVNKEKGDLLANCLSLDKHLKEKQVYVENMKSDCCNLNLKLSMMVENEKKSDAELFNLKNTIRNLKIELSSKNEEKKIVDNSVGIIKEQLKYFKIDFEGVKSELCKRNKEILELQLEKQKIFMINNWKICELEKNKELMYKNKIEKKIGLYKEQERTSLEKVANLENIIVEKEDNIKILKDEIRERDETVHDLQNKIIYNEFIIDETCEDLPKFIVNNYANFNVDIIKILEYICKLCKIENNTIIMNNNNVNISNSDYVKLLFNQIDLHIQQIYCQLQEKDHIVKHLKLNNKFKTYYITKLKQLEERCNTLHDKNGEFAAILSVLSTKKYFHNELDETNHLKALLQVKEHEKKEQQKKYELNYRTLIRKVKEHMKGRKNAEKHNKYIQECYNALCDENNLIKLQLSSKQYEIDYLKHISDDYRKNNDKMRNRLANLEKNLINEDLVKRELESLKKRFENSEETECALESELQITNDTVNNLQKINQDLLFKNLNISNDKNTLLKNIEKLTEEKYYLTDKLNEAENNLITIRNSFEDTKRLFVIEKENVSKISSEKLYIKEMYAELKEQQNYIIREFELANANIENKEDELKELCIQQEDANKNWTIKERDMQNFILSLKTQLHSLQNEINSLKSDKLFLKRLCNDLKTALKTHVDQNKRLKEQRDCDRDKREFSSLPHTTFRSHFSLSNKYDEDYINRLLEENKMPQDKSFNDIQGCLDELKKEIMNLQKQIVEKNVAL